MDVVFEDLRWIEGNMTVKDPDWDYTCHIVEKTLRGDIELINSYEGQKYWISVCGGWKCYGDGKITWEVSIFDESGENVTYKFYPNVQRQEGCAPYLTKNDVNILLNKVIHEKPLQLKLYM